MNKVPGKIIEFLSRVDSNYPGLGLPVLYGTLSVAAGKSVFYIAGRGKGKTAIVNLVPQVADELMTRWDTFALSELSERVGQVSDAVLEWRVEELGTLSKYHREIFLTVCAKIISEGAYRHQTQQLFIDIRRCQLVLLVAVQPGPYSELCRKYPQWESMSFDRFSKFLVLNPLRNKISDPPKVPIEMERLQGTIDKVVFTMPTSALDPVESLFHEQLSEARAWLYARDYVKAFTLFLGDSRVEERHIRLFARLFRPYLDAFNRLQTRYKDSLDQSFNISAGELTLLGEIGSHMDGVRKDSLAAELKVTERQIELVAARLLERQVITNQTHRGQRGERTLYLLAPWLREHFDEYGRNFSV